MSSPPASVVTSCAASALPSTVIVPAVQDAPPSVEVCRVFVPLMVMSFPSSTTTSLGRCCRTWSKLEPSSSVRHNPASVPTIRTSGAPGTAVRNSMPSEPHGAAAIVSQVCPLSWLTTSEVSACQNTRSVKYAGCVEWAMEDNCW